MMYSSCPNFIVQASVFLCLLIVQPSHAYKSLPIINCSPSRCIHNELILKKYAMRSRASNSYLHMSSSNSISSSFTQTSEPTQFNSSFYFNIDKQIANIALPAFVSLVADPLASMVDALYIGRLDPVNQAGMGISIAAHYAISKLYNDPLLKTSTSLVAGKNNEELSASVSSAMIIALIIGILQTVIFIFFGGKILSVMNVPLTSEMRKPALDYLKWRAAGVPASTALLVGIGIFRGRGDTKTPLLCSAFGSLLNIALDPLFIFTFQMGCAGAGAATAISQWFTAIPLLYFLNKSTNFLSYYSPAVGSTNTTTTATTTTSSSSSTTFSSNNTTNTNSNMPIVLSEKEKQETKEAHNAFIHLKTRYLKEAFLMYFKAGGLIFLRTIAKVAAYAVTSSYAAGLGTIAMAAYSLTFNLGFATSQLCESISVAAQALLARELPYDSITKQKTVTHIIQRSLLLGLVVSGSLAMVTYYNMNNVLSAMAKSIEVQELAMKIMPVVLITQLFKGVAYASGGVLLGGRDWNYSTLSMILSTILSIISIQYLSFHQMMNLTNVWITLALFMATQVVVALVRILSKTGPWEKINLFPDFSSVPRFWENSSSKK